MKLDDIDRLNEYRTEWKRRRNQLAAVNTSYPDKLVFSSTIIPDQDILAAVRDFVRPLVQTKLDEAKTRLMMLGVDEFPE